MKMLQPFSLTVFILIGLVSQVNRAYGNSALWIGVPGVSVSTNWSDNNNWTNIGVGNAGFTNNDVIFGNTGTLTTDNTVSSVADTSDFANSMVFTNQTGNFHTVLIPAGVTLANSNALTVGLATPIDANLTKVNFAGSGTLLQRGGMTVRNNSVNQGASLSLATLDLSGLTNFVYTNATGTIAVSGTGSETRAGGALILAGGSNNITVGTINFNTTGGNVGNNAGSAIRLGAGTNVININTLNVIAGKVTSGTLSFQAATGGLRLRGVNGNADDSSRATIVVANRNNTGTGTPNGTVDLTGHPVDVKATNINIAQCIGQNPGSVQNNIGSFRFNSGTVDAINVNLAVNSQANVNSTGNLVVGSGGTLVVSNLSLVNQTGGTGTGNLFVGGVINASGNIFKTTTAGVANMTVTNGTVNTLAGKAIGSPAAPLDTLTIASATFNIGMDDNVTNISVATLDMQDSANTANITTLPSISGFPTVLPLVTYASSIGAGSLNLGTLPSSFTGFISNDTVNTLWLVITNGPFVNKTVRWGGGVNNLWDTTTPNWTNAGGAAVTFANGDFVTFNDVAQTNKVNLTGARLPSSLTVSNNALNYELSGSGSIGGTVDLIKDGSASLTLAQTGGDNFSGGVVISNGTVIFDNANSAISGGLTVQSGGTAQIGNNGANGLLPAGPITIDGALVFKRGVDLTVGVPIPGSGSLTQNGTARTTLTATNSYTGNTLVTSGTLALATNGSIATSAQVAVSGATLDLSEANGPRSLEILNLTNSSVRVRMPNLLTPLNVAGLNMGGVGNSIHVTALPPVATYPVNLTLIQSAAAISGFNMTLGSLPAATPPYAGSVSASGTAVILTLTSGPTGARPAVFWSGADVPNLNTNWSDAQNWYLPGVPGSTDLVIFGSNATAAASALTTPGGGSSALDPTYFNNFVDANFTVASLTYTNMEGTHHNTRLNDGRTLSLTNTLTVGAVDVGGAGQQQGVSISGNAATLGLNNTNANLQVWLGNSSTAGSTATLDLSALDNLSATLNRLCVGAAAINNAVNRPSGILYLAKTNTIDTGFQTSTSQAGTTTGNSGIVVGDCNQNAGPASYLYLGRVNTISADTIGIARQKTTAAIVFNPAHTNVAPYPRVTLQGHSAGVVSILAIGDGLGNTGTTTGNGRLDLSGGLVNASVDTLFVGRASSGGTSGGTTTGELTFDAGTISVNNLQVGLQTAANPKIAIGTVNVATNSVIGQAAQLVVNGNLTLGNATGGTGAASTVGTLNIAGGLAQVNNIVAGANGGMSTINLTGGKLIIGNTAGTPASPLTTLALNGGTLQLNVNGAAGAAPVVATTINVSGTTVLNIGSFANVTAAMTIPLISYTGADPFASLALGTVPPGYNVLLVDNTANSTIDLQIMPPPSFFNISISGGNVLLSGANGPAGSNYVVLTSTNVGLPLSSWTRLTTNQFGLDGSFSFSHPHNWATPQRFYLLQVP